MTKAKLIQMASGIKRSFEGQQRSSEAYLFFRIKCSGG